MEVRYAGDIHMGSVNKISSVALTLRDNRFSLKNFARIGSMQFASCMTYSTDFAWNMQVHSAACKRRLFSPIQSEMSFIYTNGYSGGCSVGCVWLILSDIMFPITQHRSSLFLSIEAWYRLEKRWEWDTYILRYGKIKNQHYKKAWVYHTGLEICSEVNGISYPYLS